MLSFSIVLASCKISSSGVTLTILNNQPALDELQELMLLLNRPKALTHISIFVLELLLDHDIETVKLKMDFVSCVKDKPDALAQQTTFDVSVPTMDC